MSELKKSVITEAVNIIANSDIDLSTMFNQDGLLKQLTKELVEKALDGELKNHLGYEKYKHNDTSDNYRNGHSTKNLITDQGPLDIKIPRDRQGSFDPQIVSKHQNRIKGLDEKIISLYAKGMSINDIHIQLKELYGAEISPSLISDITSEVIDLVLAWQNRPLESIYPIVYFDCLRIKVREDKRIINKAVYVALGIDLSGRKDILGLWISENEGSKFWLGVMTELKNRGISDILIACTDNLTGMSDSISAVFPKTQHQLCIVHQIRNSLKYVSYKDRKVLAADLKPIYTAVNEEQAHAALESFEEKWSKQYPHIAKSWYTNWENLVIFLEYPNEIRKVIYTTNAIESVNSQFRKVTKNKRVFPNDESVFKTLYLSIDYITKKWTMPIRDWNAAIAHFMIKFEDRVGSL